MAHIRRWQPFTNLAPYARFPFSAWFDFSPTFEPLATTSRLGLDVMKDDEGYTIQASLPGVSADDIDVTIEGGILKIEATTASEESKDDSSYVIRERRRGSYHRAIRLPENVDVDNASTDYTNGVLTVKLPVGDESGLKRLPINVG